MKLPEPKLSRSLQLPAIHGKQLYAIPFKEERGSSAGGNNLALESGMEDGAKAMVLDWDITFM